MLLKTCLVIALNAYIRKESHLLHQEARKRMSYASQRK